MTFVISWLSEAGVGSNYVCSSLQLAIHRLSYDRCNGLNMTFIKRGQEFLLDNLRLHHILHLLHLLPGIQIRLLIAPGVTIPPTAPDAVEQTIPKPSELCNGNLVSYQE